MKTERSRYLKVSSCSIKKSSSRIGLASLVVCDIWGHQIKTNFIPIEDIQVESSSKRLRRSSHNNLLFIKHVIKRSIKRDNSPYFVKRMDVVALQNTLPAHARNWAIIPNRHWFIDHAYDLKDVTHFLIFFSDYIKGDKWRSLFIIES